MLLGEVCIDFDLTVVIKDPSADTATLIVKHVPVGKEDIDVKIDVQLSTGKILKAQMDNPIEIAERVCADAGYTNCKPEKRYQIRR